LSVELLANTDASPINRINPLLSLGRIRTRRDQPDAWECLDEAATIAEGLRRAELDRRRPARACRSALARRYPRQVSAWGRTGRQLFISAKTVDHHVGAVLAKMGASSRSAAASEAARLGL
jgi:hypothetical protein